MLKMSAPEKSSERLAPEAQPAQQEVPLRPTALAYGSPEMYAAKTRLKEERLGLMGLGGLTSQLTLELRPVPESIES